MVLSCHKYLIQGYKELDNPNLYRKLFDNPTIQYMEEINLFISKMHDKGEISTNVFEYLFTSQNLKKQIKHNLSSLDSLTPKEGTKHNKILDFFKSPHSPNIMESTSSTTLRLRIPEQSLPRKSNSFSTHLSYKKRIHNTCTNPKCQICTHLDKNPSFICHTTGETFP